jgi:hypothetical protein
MKLQSEKIMKGIDSLIEIIASNDNNSISISLLHRIMKFRINKIKPYFKIILLQEF